MQYIIRILRSGVLAEGELTVSNEGVAQGSICSPVLSNIFGHYVIDLWFEEVVKKHSRGEVKLVRYCDDMVIACQYEYDARRIKSALTKRLSKFKMKLNDGKTRVINFRRCIQNRSNFDFLGLTIYWGASKKGHAIPKLKTIGSRMRAKLNEVTKWIKKVRNKYTLKEIWKSVCLKLEGHVQYYGVSHNTRAVGTFIRLVESIIFKWLNRRSQRKSFDWDKFNMFLKINPLPKSRVCYKMF